MLSRLTLCWLALGCSSDSSGNPDGNTGGERANRVFALMGSFPMPLDIPAIDAMCTSTANAAGLDGTFVAWLSTSTAPAPTRLAGSRGWVRPDGAPVVDEPAGLLNGAMFNPIMLDATGDEVTANVTVWTGTNADGTVGDNCADWTSMTGEAVHGLFGGGSSTFTSAGTSSCTSRGSVHCFETGHSLAVTPTAATDDHRRIFLSTPRTTALSIGALDAQCQSEASAAGLPGTYKAAVANTGATIAERFTSDERVVRRVDGTQVAFTAGALFAGLSTSLLNQRADGTYVGVQAGFEENYFFSGALDGTEQGTSVSTCNSWTATTGTARVGDAAISGEPNTLWFRGVESCASALGVLCFQD